MTLFDDFLVDYSSTHPFEAVISLRFFEVGALSGHHEKFLARNLYTPLNTVELIGDRANVFVYMFGVNAAVNSAFICWLVTNSYNNHRKSAACAALFKKMKAKFEARMAAAKQRLLAELNGKSADQQRLFQLMEEAITMYSTYPHVPSLLVNIQNIQTAQNSLAIEIYNLQIIYLQPIPAFEQTYANASSSSSSS